MNTYYMKGKLVTIEGYGKCKLCGYVFSLTEFHDGVNRTLDDKSPCCHAAILPYRKRANNTPK